MRSGQSYAVHVILCFRTMYLTEVVVRLSVKLKLLSQALL